MTEKVSKIEAEYRSYPKGNDWCARCTMFRNPDQCITVKGYISRTGWCKYFEAKRKYPNDIPA
jgi:hypothetical protein